MQTRKEYMELLIKQAQEQPEFRKALLADPKKLIEAKLNITLPESFTINVHEESGDSLHIVLPLQNEELSHAELEIISGGGACWCMGDATVMPPLV